MTSHLGSRWSDDERRACVNAYANLWYAQRTGKGIIKADVIRALLNAELAQRNEASVRMRFANISAVMEAAGKMPLEGYVPARNISPAEHVRLGRMLADEGLI